jgi:hypothetical protein
MVSRGARRHVRINSAPVAADTIGGTTGINSLDVGLGAVLGEHQVRYAYRGEQPAERACRPQHPVEVDSRALADQILADDDRSGADGEQRHRRRAVKMTHLRVVRVTAGHRRMPHPMCDHRDDEDHQPYRRRDPDHQCERPQTGDVQRQRRTRGGHNAGAHDRGEPVRAQKAQQSLPVSRRHTVIISPRACDGDVLGGFPPGKFSGKRCVAGRPRSIG